MSEQPLVKELQWRFFDVTHEYGKGVWDANGPWTTYTIQVCDEARAAPAERYYVPALSDVFSDLDAAKAAAQADYERRILSALTPAPVRAEGEAITPCSPVVSVKEMRLSDGRSDFFVAVKVGDREITPYVFRVKSKAEFEVETFRWLFGQAEKPEIREWIRAGRFNDDPAVAALKAEDSLHG